VTRTSQPHYNSWFANNPRPAIALTFVTYLLLGALEKLPGTFGPPLLYFLALGVFALVAMPFLLELPNGRKPLREYCQDIRLLPAKPLGRNILLGILMATLTLSSILLASILTRHFVLDWSLVPALRWVKGLTRGIWEEVFFRGIILVLFMRIFSKRTAVFLAAFFFALVHLNPFAVDFYGIVDVISIFFMALLFTYLVLMTGSLWPAIVFHYLHDVFVLLVQNTPGAEKAPSSALLFACLWCALLIGALLTRYIVKRWPTDVPHTATPA
jgi:membrane protease YdiL (CAAX protease family)